MSNAQTEARAIARFRIDWEHDDTGYPDLVRVWSDDGPFVSYDDHATALAAKDAELVEAWQRYVDANEARIDAEAALAEARKALDALTGPEADMRDYHEGIVGSLAAKINAYEAAMEPFAKAGELFADPSPDYAHLELIWRPAAGDAYALYADHLRAARRAREGGRDA